MDWNYWLGVKYGLLGQHAAADVTRSNASANEANANANVANIRAGLMPAESSANLALTGAQTQSTLANAAQTGIENKYLPAKSLADIAEARARAGLDTAQGANYSADTARTNIYNLGLSNLGPGLFQSSGNPLVDAARARVLGGGY